MANNRQSESKLNHSSSSEEEEEEVEEASGSEDEQTGSESEEISGSDSDEKQNQKHKKTPIAAPQSTKKIPPASSDSEESDSESEFESGSQRKKPNDKVTPVADPNIKPIASKPMEQEDGASKRSRSKTSSKHPSAKSAKRPASAASEKDSKKAKKSPATEDDSKKQLFQRLWSEDDEIVILQGMIDYKTEKKGADPVADLGAFHEFIKKSLHVDVSKSQLGDKVRRLKKKYVNNASKEKDGKERNFAKSHDQRGYELSKLIWGSDGSNGGTAKNKIQTKRNSNAKGNGASTPIAALPKSPNAKGNGASTSTAIPLPKSNGVEAEKEISTMDIEKNLDVSRFVQYGGNGGCPILEGEIVKAGMELVEGSKKEELEEKWKKLRVQEMELYLKRMELLQEQTKLVLEAINSSGN